MNAIHLFGSVSAFLGTLAFSALIAGCTLGADPRGEIPSLAKKASAESTVITCCNTAADYTGAFSFNDAVHNDVRVSPGTCQDVRVQGKPGLTIDLSGTNLAGKSFFIDQATVDSAKGGMIALGGTADSPQDWY